MTPSPATTSKKRPGGRKHYRAEALAFSIALSDRSIALASPRDHRKFPAFGIRGFWRVDQAGLDNRAAKQTASSPASVRESQKSRGRKQRRAGWFNPLTSAIVPSSDGSIALSSPCGYREFPAPDVGESRAADW